MTSSGAGPSEAAKWAVGSLKGSARRIQRELEEINQSTPDNCSAGPKGDNLYEWAATIVGPKGTPYENGVFFLSITLPPDYPFNAPTVRFRTRIYHCNINSKGMLCSSLIEDNWSPTQTLSDVLVMIVTILYVPNPHDPLVGSIAMEYLTDRREHDDKAREWTIRFAT